MKFSQRIFTLTLITQCMPLLLAERIPVLIVDGQNNHDWVSTTDSLQATLEATKRFTVKIETAPQTKSIKGIRAPRSSASSYRKKAYQSLREAYQQSENKNKAMDERA